MLIHPAQLSTNPVSVKPYHQNGYVSLIQLEQLFLVVFRGVRIEAS